MDFVTEIAGLIATETGLPAADIKPYIEVPPQSELGDFAFPCFRLAKTLRQAPPQIAADLAAKLTPLPPYLTKIVQAGGYLNFFIDRSILIQAAFELALASDRDLGAGEEGRGKTVLIEYSSPNIAKPFHIGHGFTTILGESLARIYDRLGYNTVRMNHLGDYGTQFGKLIVAYGIWGDDDRLEKEPIDELLRIYVKFHQEAEHEMEISGKSELEERAREAFRRLEQGEAYERELWQRFRDVSLQEFNRVYDRLGIHFDNLNGESFYSDRIPAVVTMLKEKGLLEESQGAQVVRLDEEGLPPCIILKSDGTTIYASRDIAAVLYRDEKWHFDRNIYVVGLPQTLHFKQVFGVLRKAGYECADRCRHIGFGTVKLPDGAISTRQGSVIKLDDLFNEAVNKCAAIIKANAEARQDEMSAEEIQEIAEKVGLGAVIYMFVKSSRERDIVFKWDEVLDFDGDTAPYLQYTYARAKSILRRASAADTDVPPTDIDCALINSDTVFQIARDIEAFGNTVRQAAETGEPFMVARQISQIARAFNRFYNTDPILSTADRELRRARLLVCRAVCRALREGLFLLGIETVEKM